MYFLAKSHEKVLFRDIVYMRFSPPDPFIKNHNSILIIVVFFNSDFHN